MTTSNKDRLFTLINDMSDEEQQDLIAELEERQSRDRISALAECCSKQVKLEDRFQLERTLY